MMKDKDYVTNTSTGLMRIKDLSSLNGIPINIHFSDEFIHIIVGFGTYNQRRMSFRPQDCYKRIRETDEIYEWIVKTVEELRSENNESIREIY